MSPSEIKAAWSSGTMVVYFPYKLDTVNQHRLNVVPKSAMLAGQLNGIWSKVHSGYSPNAGQNRCFLGELQSHLLSMESLPSGDVYTLRNHKLRRKRLSDCVA